MFDSSLVWLAFGLTLFAGLCTGIGSLLAFTARPTNHKFLSLALGFSAGVMLYVSFVEILTKAQDALTSATTPETGYILATIGFFIGVISIMLIDKAIDAHHGNPHELHDATDMDDTTLQKKHKLLRMGTFTAIAIAVHNFPEGFATFLGTLQDPSLGVAIAVAVAIHNIPEGIAVSIPVYHATGSRMKAFWYSFASGIVEPVGALLGYIFLMQFFGDMMFGITFAAVAGIMVFISLDQLLPTAEKYGEHHLSIYGLIAGMMVMSLSLVLFL